MADMPLVSPIPSDPSVEQLLELIAQRDAVLAAQQEQLAAQAEQINTLMAQAAQVEILVDRVAQLETRLSKNSRNSSKPPSSDDTFTKPPPRPRSLRKASGRKPGKQPGDSGSGLAPRQVADEVIVHAPDACTGCGADLDAAAVVGEHARQVFDLPPIELLVAEHRAQQRACSCGHVTTAAFPAEATAPTCYGPGIEALGTYLMARQHLPVARCAELMGEVVGSNVSTGYLAGLLGRAEDNWRVSSPTLMSSWPPKWLEGSEDWQIERMAIYAAQVESLDRGVGRLRTALEEAGVLDNTLILFSVYR